MFTASVCRLSASRMCPLARLWPGSSGSVGVFVGVGGGWWARSELTFRNPLTPGASAQSAPHEAELNE